jgi:hypothetical protein
VVALPFLESAEVTMQNDFVGKPAGIALDHFGVGYDDLSMIDEPPGKLQGVSFTARKADTGTPVVLWLKYGTELFSAEREWGLQQIRSATVREVAVNCVV